MKQLNLKFANNYKNQFGGELLLGKRKSRRPLSIKKPIHLVLRSGHKGLFRPTNTSLEKLIYRMAGKYQIRVYDLALNWSHIHAVIMLKDRHDYIRFIRALTSIIALKTRASLDYLKQIFSLRPFTRVLEWGKDFKNVQKYVYLNQLEAFGYISRPKIKASTQGTLRHLNLLNLAKTASNSPRAKSTGHKLTSLQFQLT